MTYLRKDLSCLLPYAPVTIKFSENENGLNVTWKWQQGNSSIIWNNILITTISGIQ